MITDVESAADHLANNRAWYEQLATGWARWLRAGGRLGEWANNTVTDIQFASQALFLEEGETVLNLSCGWGRHAITLAHYGLTVIGLDASYDLVQLARETSEHAKVDVRWVNGDLNDLHLSEPVDAVVQFNDNVLEWAESPAEAIHLLDQVHAILKEDGRFLFGNPDWTTSPPKQEQSQAETAEGREIYRQFFDSDSRTARFHTLVINRDGSQREYLRRNWHPSAEQMAALLFQANFEIEGQFNDWSFLPYDPKQPGLVWLVQKA